MCIRDILYSVRAHRRLSGCCADFERASPGRTSQVPRRLRLKGFEAGLGDGGSLAGIYVLLILAEAQALLYDLEQASGSHSSADTHGDHDVLRPSAFAFDECVTSHSCTAHSVRMAYGN